MLRFRFGAAQRVVCGVLLLLFLYSANTSFYIGEENAVRPYQKHAFISISIKLLSRLPLERASSRKPTVTHPESSSLISSSGRTAAAVAAAALRARSQAGKRLFSVLKHTIRALSCRSRRPQRERGPHVLFQHIRTYKYTFQKTAKRRTT